MKRLLAGSLWAVTAMVTLASMDGHQGAWAHCQVPCGIYDDPARIQALLEDAATIAKAMNEINLLAGKSDPQSLNQTVRWITTKETHASHVITTVAEYFLTQKVKEVEPGAAEYAKYLESLATHHRVMRAAMKTKQTVEPSDAAKLRAAVEALGKLYDLR